MSLADEIQAHGVSLIGRQSAATCTMRMVLDLLSDEDRVALEGLLEDRRVFGTTIADVLNGFAPRVAEQAAKADGASRNTLEHLAELCSGMMACTVQRHRRGECKCGRVAI